jgi:hypothetical protein
MTSPIPNEYNVRLVRDAMNAARQQQQQPLMILKELFPNIADTELQWALKQV